MAASKTTSKSLQKRQKRHKKQKFRPTEKVKISTLKGMAKRDAKKWDKVAFTIRKNVKNHDRAKAKKLVEHGDNYILRKMFVENPYEKFRNKTLKRRWGKKFAAVRVKKRSGETGKRSKKGKKAKKKEFEIPENMYKGRKVVDLGANLEEGELWRRALPRRMQWRWTRKPIGYWRKM